jgi:predicted porin
MKKISIAAAITLAATAASAANVTLYGIVDMGVTVQRVNGETSVQMRSGNRNSSRVGLKGTEDLGNGYKVGFILENQFSADTGKLQTEGTLWERESSLSLATPYGKFTFGRVGYLKGVVGSTALLNSYRVNPFGGVMSSYVTGFKPYTTGTTYTVNNGIVYGSPKIANTEFFLQYSNGYSSSNGDDTGTMNSNDRYYAAAVRYMNGPLFLQAIADTTNLGHHAGEKASVTDKNSRDPMSIGIQAAYDFGYIKPYFMIEAFKNSQLNKVGGSTGRTVAKTGGHDGVGGTLVLQWPMLGGKAKVGGGYLKADRAKEASPSDKFDVSRYGFSVGYDYVITKRTHVYCDAGYFHQKEEEQDKTTKSHGSEFVMGMVHYF